MDQHRCEICHGELPPSKGGRPRKHCDSCRALYTRRLRKTDLIWLSCGACGGDFLVGRYRSNAHLNERRVCSKCDATHSYCFACEAVKPRADFSRNTRQQTGLNYYCRQCMVGKRVLHRKKYPGRLRDAELRRNYGITLVEYEQILTGQGGLCAICSTTPELGKVLEVDHDHGCCLGRKSCGKCIRGLLCGDCNLGLACFKDDTDRFSKAVAYLLT